MSGYGPHRGLLWLAIDRFGSVAARLHDITRAAAIGGEAAARSAWQTGQIAVHGHCPTLTEVRSPRTTLVGCIDSQYADLFHTLLDNCNFCIGLLAGRGKGVAPG